MRRQTSIKLRLWMPLPIKPHKEKAKCFSKRFNTFFLFVFQDPLQAVSPPCIIIFNVSQLREARRFSLRATQCGTTAQTKVTRSLFPVTDTQSLALRWAARWHFRRLWISSILRHCCQVCCRKTGRFLHLSKVTHCVFHCGNFWRHYVVNAFHTSNSDAIKWQR